MRKLAMLLLIPLLSGCAQSTYEPFTPTQPLDETWAPTDGDEEPAPVQGVVGNTTSLDDPPPAESVRFLIIGDQGAGNEAQFAVGEAMKAACVQRGCDFVMTTGDNIYDFGAFTADDPQFIDKFEEPYAGMTNSAGDEMPFYLSLGNHDNFFGGFAQAVGEAQVDYHHKTDRPSSMWNMPDRYYSIRFGNVLEIFALDTDSLYKNDFSVDVTPEEHQAWARDALEASDATWKLAFGHYNYVSNGNYGDGNADFKAAMEASICDRAHFYAFGHDHDLQWIKPVESCGRTEFIGSSAASKARSVDQDFEFDAYFGAGDVYGFAWIEMVGDTMRLQFIDDELNVLYERTTTTADMGF